MIKLRRGLKHLQSIILDYGGKEEVNDKYGKN